VDRRRRSSLVVLRRSGSLRVVAFLMFVVTLHSRFGGVLMFVEKLDTNTIVSISLEGGSKTSAINEANCSVIDILEKISLEHGHVDA
jgi:hypothetical protein